MRVFLLFTLIFFMNISTSQANMSDFQVFISELKKAAEQKNIAKISAVFSNTYIRADKFLHYVPETTLAEVRNANTEFFYTAKFNDESIVGYKEERFEFEDDLYKWTREAEYRGYEGQFYDITIEFTLVEDGFVVAPHFTHPSAQQLDKLESMDKLYSLYYVRENVAAYTLFVNDKKIEMLNDNVKTIQLLDLQKGNNKIAFTFNNIDEKLPAKFAVSIAYAPRNQMPRKVRVDNVIDLLGSALEVDEWGDLTVSTTKLTEVQTQNIEWEINLD